MPPELQTAIEPLGYLCLIGLVFAPLERLFAAHERRSHLKMDLAFATLGAVIVAFAVPLIAGKSLGSLWHFSLVDFDQGVFRTTWPGRVFMFAMGVFLFELVGYLYHRAAHTNALLWRLHRIHHSAAEMDWLTSFRQHPLEIVLMTVLQNAPLVLLGLSLGDHALVLLFIKANAVFVHANLKIPSGPWSRVFAMPHFHHTHHRYGDANQGVVNYAAMFPWIDRLFGTYSAQRSKTFGLTEKTPKTFARALFLAKE
jgi:sterol desaturase/sphingolipid hydroxylase (fatty acid hydroxylase superfamily)